MLPVSAPILISAISLAQRKDKSSLWYLEVFHEFVYMKVYRVVLLGLPM